MKKIIIALAITLAALSPALACEFTLKLVDGAGTERRILPGSRVNLEAGRDYTLHIDFLEDHRNCAIAPEATRFTLDGIPWQNAAVNAGLALKSPIAWEVKSRSLNAADIGFTARTAGNFSLRMDRDCPKGGYHETITFVVQ